jgi:hypothetical protein
MENDENIQSSNKLIVNMSLYMRGVKINNLSVDIIVVLLITILT